ncbi:MAG: RsmD family RNA methyltransferase [Deltaproteobacteria bacterium]|nr:RsmD family RNA methyltransferase [Deltaproteobacteria bacterium]
MTIEVTGTAIVTRKGLRRARHGWPWLSKDDIVEYDGDGGPFVDLVDETSLPMGTALWDPDGPAPVRLLSSARTRDPVGLMQTRLERAVARRDIDLAGADAGRLCAGEADGLPGLVVDRFGNGLLVQVDAAAMRPVVDVLLAPLVKRVDASVVALAMKDQVTLLQGAASRVRFLHGRLELSIDLAAHVTRRVTGELEAQRTLRRWARGRCLDLYAGFCGYGLQLADGGAREITVVDVPALLSANIEDDARHNQIEARFLRVPADPLTWLRAESDEHARFDVVVFHPPATEADDDAAVARATEHGALCLKLLDEGGILAAQPTSAALDEVSFASALQEAAARSRKRLQILARLGAGPDHPTLAGVRPPPTLLVARVLATA